MVLRLQAVIEANAAQAKAEIGAVSGSLDKMAAATDRAEDQAGQLAAAQLRAAGTARRFGQANRLATGSMANLTAQFNDVGIMMAAGQNPLQLALQQGTQITQVIGPLGAAGAVRALGGAFMSLLNPVTLVTIGAIGAGAAFVQWLTSAREDVQSFEDAVSDLEAAVTGYGKAVDRAVTPMTELREEWGSQAAAVRDVYRAMEELARLEALTAIGAARQSIADEFEGIANRIARIDRDREAELFGDDATKSIERQLRKLNNEFGLTEGQARGLLAALDQVGASRGPAETAEAFGAIRAILLEVAESTGQLPGGLLEVAQSAADAELQARTLSDITSDAADEAERLGSAAASAGDGFASALPVVETLYGRVSALAQAAWSYAGAMARERYAYDTKVGGGRGADPRLFGGSAQDILQNDPRVQLSYAGQNGQRPDTGAGAATARTIDAAARLLEQEELRLALMRETDPVEKEMIRNRQALAGATQEQRARLEELITLRVAEEQQMASLQAQQEAFADTAYNAIDGLILQGESLADTFDNVSRAIASAVLQATLLGQGPLAGLFGFGGDEGGGVLGAIAGAIFPGLAEGGLVYGPGSGTSDDVLMVTPSGATVRASSGEYLVNAKATARNRHLLELINAGAEIPGYAGGGHVGAEDRGRYGSAPGQAGGDGREVRQINNFNIQTPDAQSFVRSRAGVARRAQQLVSAARRVS